MDKPLSKTAALRAAQSACGRIIRRSSTDYVCYVPFYDRPGGPTTELQASDYWKCRLWRTRRVASRALVLMGYDRSADDFALEWEIERAVTYVGATNAKEIVEAVVESMSEEPPSCV